jgi:hypothetical protein
MVCETETQTGLMKEPPKDVKRGLENPTVNEKQKELMTESALEQEILWGDVKLMVHR